MRSSLRMDPSRPKPCGCWMTSFPEFGRDKTPLLGGGCNRFGNGGFNHRASRLGRECSGLRALQEDVGAIFCCRVQSTAKTGAPERARRCDRLPGKGLPWVGAALRAAAFEGESTSWPCWESAGSYFIDSVLAGGVALAWVVQWHLAPCHGAFSSRRQKSGTA